MLLTGRASGDLLFLQVKQAQQSVLSAYAGTSRYASHGERVVAGQRLMQVASDMFLGWQSAGPKQAPPLAGPQPDYYVRQLRDWKFSVASADMRPAVMLAYGALCGRTLARAHARTADRIAIAAYLGKSAAFDSAVTEFAMTPVRPARTNVTARPYRRGSVGRAAARPDRHPDRISPCNKPAQLAGRCRRTGRDRSAGDR